MMSANGVNIEDAEMAECDGEKVVTMMDVLQEQQEFEEDANAVLGASDDKNCTYNQGYIKRQAIYACLTCCNEAKEDPTKRAGVCLACSLTCHENHDLVELYTKRNFCCDCGNPKFNHPCQYTPNKTDLNDENKYNQNFSGLYCTCHRPYPDPEGVEEEMIQCVICEDWLHASHLEATVPSSEAYVEMICKGCMEKNDFLHDYGKYAVNGDIDISINESVSSVCNGDTSKLNGDDEVEEEVANVEKEANVEEESKELTNEVTSNSEQKLTGDTELAESENPSLANDDNKDEQIDQNITDSESTVVDKSEESEDKPKETVDKTEENEGKSEGTPVTEETAANKDENEEHITGNEGTEKLEDTSELTSSESKEESSVDNSEVIANDNKNETDTEPKQEENPVPTDTNESDAKMEEAVGNTSKDGEIEPKTNVTETEISTDINGITNDQPDDSKEEKESTEPIVKENTEKDIEMDENSKVEENTAEEQTKENKRKLSTEEAVDITSVKKPKLEGSCTRPRNERKVFKGATFWPSQFRQKLCTCSECLAMYKDLSVLFLIDLEDTVSAYEVLGKERSDGTTTQYEKGLEALSSLGRIQQINALTEYNKMRDKLLDFLKSFKDRKEVVKEDDIKAFFAGMKPKREPDGVYFCK